MRIYLLFIFVFIFGISFSQKATVAGVITDLSYNSETLPGVSVILKGTTTGTQTDLNGKYSIDLNEGNHTLVFNYIGYTPIEVPISVKAGEKKTINQGLTSNSISIDAIVIEIAQSREKESALLIQQQKSIEIKQNIGAQELSRKGVGDVAAAVTKTSGVSKQEGSGNVYVRGLGDRYNSTSINGLPVASNDPGKKNIDLELFSTDIVEYISIDKVYGPQISGDFAGGNVDISSKNYKGDGMFEITLGSSVNSNAVENNGDFLLQDGPNKFGFSNYWVPENALNSYNFQNSLNPVHETPFGGNVGLKGGKSFNIGNEGRMNLFATANFDNGFEYREGLNQATDSHGNPLKSFQQEKFSYKTNTTGMFNANYSINENHGLHYNFLFVNSSEQSRDIYKGFIRDLAENDNGLLQRGSYVQNTLFIHQLLGNHSFTEKMNLDWGVSFNEVEGNMPDRTQNTLGFRDNLDGYTLIQNSTTDNHRYYQNLTEKEWAANMVLSREIGEDDNGNPKGKISLGYKGRFKEREFQAIQYNFNILASERLTTVLNPNRLDDFFNTQNYNNGLFTISAFAGDAFQVYNGEQNIHAGFAGLEYRFSDKLSSIIGLRFERIEQTVDWRTQLDASGDSNTLSRNEFLPSLVLKYELDEKQNLRLGASKTYTLPQFKERARFIYEDVTETTFGNPYLYSSENYNLDLKWEMFPQDDELLSVTAFGKYITDPINETTIASSTNDISYTNTGDYGYVYGVEVEVRKNIFSLDEEKDNKLSAGLNVAYMKTYQELDAEKVREETNGLININLTNKESAFAGASDLLLNADLSYTRNWKNDSGIMATVAYSYFSDRIYSLGSEGRGNLVDKAVGTLDFVVKAKIDKNFGINFSAKNLLNPKIERVQENASGDILAVSYKKGLYFSLGISYQL